MTGDVTNDRDDEPETFHTAGAKLGTSRVSRRGFLRAATAGGAAAAVGGASLSSNRLGARRAEAAVSSFGPSLGIGAWVGEKIAGAFSDGDMPSDGIGSQTLMAEIEKEALSLASTQEQVLSSLRNTVEFSERVAIAEGSQAAYEVMSNDGTEDEAREAREEAINEYFAGIQKDVIQAHNSALNRFFDWQERIHNFEPLDGDEEGWGYSYDYFIRQGTSIDGTVKNVYSGTIEEYYGDNSTYVEEELYNGEKIDVKTAVNDGDDYHNPLNISNLAVMLVPPSEWHIEENDNIDEWPTSWRITSAADEQTYEEHDWRELAGRLADDEWYEHNTEEEDLGANPIYSYNSAEYAAVLDKLDEARQDVMDDMYGFEENVYAAYDGDPSEIDTSDMTTPTDMYEAASEETDHAWRDAALRSLGLDESPRDMDIKLHNRGEDGIVVEGTIYALNADLSLETDKRYEPEDFEETALYISFLDEQEVEDEDGNVETETVAVEEELNEPFTVLAATDEDGNELDEVDFNDGPTYDPSDIEEIEEALREQNERLIEMQEEAAQSGGGGISWPSNPLAGLADGAAAVVAGAIAIIFAGIALGGGD